MFTDYALATRIARARVRGKHWMLTAAMSFILFVMVLTFALAPAQAKSPGSTYCFYGKCHRVKTINETRAIVGKTISLHASHYDACGRDRYNPCGLTSSGERFYPGRPDNAASPIYPDGTILLVWNEVTGGAAVLRINNAGPYWGNRKLDVSVSTAEKLGFAHRGIAKLRTEVISAPSKSEARYVRHRMYRKVAGYIGKFKTMNEARRASSAIMAIEAIAGSSGALASPGVVASSRFETPDVLEARKGVENQANALQFAMLKSERGWIEFIDESQDAVPELNPVRPVAASFEVATALPEPFPAGGQEFSIVTAATEPGIHPEKVLGDQIRVQLALDGRTGDVALAGEWLRRAPQALVLVRATDVGARVNRDRIGRGQLDVLFRITDAGMGRVLSIGREYAGLQVLPWQNRLPNPNRWMPDGRKAARTGNVRA